MRCHLLFVIICTMFVAGCGETTAATFKEHVRSNCCQAESRVSPTVMDRDTLLATCGQPASAARDGDDTEVWVYHLSDGDVQVHVILHPGSSWDDPKPLVFVDLPRLVRE